MHANVLYIYKFLIIVTYLLSEIIKRKNRLRLITLAMVLSGLHKNNN